MREIFRQIRQDIEANLVASQLYGVAQLRVPKPEELGIPPRMDTRKSIQEALKDIYQEGLNMGMVDSIPIRPDGTATFEVFSTIASSPHTIFAVQYQEFEESWRKTLESHPEYTQIKTGPYVAGIEEKHAKYIPMQMITWVMIKISQRDNPQDYEMLPIDVYQLAETQKGEDSLPMRKMYQALGKHIDIHTTFLQNMFNHHVRGQINSRLAEIGVQLEEKAIWDIANTMGIGYYRGFVDVDGKGGSPQSNPTTHIHTSAYPDLDELRKRIVDEVITAQRSEREKGSEEMSNVSIFDSHLIYKIASLLKQNPSIPITEISALIKADVSWITDMMRHHFEVDLESLDEKSINTFFIEKADEVMRTILKFEELFNNNTAPILGDIRFSDPYVFEPETIFKLVDPYASIFFRLLDTWTQNRLLKTFISFGATQNNIVSFVHHTESHRFDMRTAEGWIIDLPNADFASIQEAMAYFFNLMNSVWKEAETAWTSWRIHEDEQPLRTFQSRFAFDDDVIDTLKQIIPTNKQLEYWIQNEVMNKKEQERIQRRLRNARDPRFLARAGKKLTGKDTLEARSALFGLLQVLDGAYTTPGENGSLKEVKFNLGYNIPGMPGFGITYVKTSIGWKLILSPLLSLKGLAEQFVGVPIVREIGKR